MRRCVHPWIVSGLLLAGCQAPQASDRSVPKPDINDRFLDPALDPADWVERFEVESREIYVERDAIVAALHLRPGDRIADIGAGTGLFLDPFAQAVGSGGRVYAVDISPRLVDFMAARAAEAGLSQVETVLSLEDSAELPPASTDVVFVCDTYHHFSTPQAMLDSIHDALRPGGRLVIVDFERIPGHSREWVLDHVRAGKATVRREIETAGFVLHGEVRIPGLSENYVLVFTRP